MFKRGTVKVETFVTPNGHRHWAVVLRTAPKEILVRDLGTGDLVPSLADAPIVAGPFHTRQQARERVGAITY
jgi:hypothetical protein